MAVSVAMALCWHWSSKQVKPAYACVSACAPFTTTHTVLDCLLMHAGALYEKQTYDSTVVACGERRKGRAHHRLPKMHVPARGVGFAHVESPSCTLDMQRCE